MTSALSYMDRWNANDVEKNFREMRYHIDRGSVAMALLCFDYAIRNLENIEDKDLSKTLNRLRIDMREYLEKAIENLIKRRRP